jgi:hypothetical protein
MRNSKDKYKLTITDWLGKAKMKNKTKQRHGSLSKNGYGRIEDMLLTVILKIQGSIARSSSTARSSVRCKSVSLTGQV